MNRAVVSEMEHERSHRPANVPQRTKTYHETAPELNPDGMYRYLPVTPQNEVPTQMRQANETSATPPPTPMPGPSSKRKNGET